MHSQRHQAQSLRGQNSYSSASSEFSGYSRSTAPTDYSDRPGEVELLNDTVTVSGLADNAVVLESRCEDDGHSSVVTYASTIPSEDDAPVSEMFEVPMDRQRSFVSTALPSSPPEFARLFPSNRRLLIRHDDSTPDGNMNLRIDTEIIEPKAKLRTLTLFHLRLKDLRSRQASLRRYCRDSGREVCHSSRKSHSPVLHNRPVIQRSLSSALQTIGLNGLASRARPEMKRSFTFDSNDEDRDDHETFKTSPTPAKLDKAMHLEFSNYAHVNLKSLRNKASKRYDFEYWGIKYQWRREVRREGGFTEISYHLVNTSTSAVLAHIMPELLTKREVLEEEYKGGWIPPSSLWISDKEIPQGPPDISE